MREIEEKAKIKKFIPSIDEEFYYVSKSTKDSSYKIYISYNENPYDELIVNNFLVFRTREDAEIYKRYLETLDKYSFKPNWNDMNQYKFYIIYNHIVDSLCIDFYCYIQTSNNKVFFKSEEQAQQFINEVGKDNVKKFMFDIENTQ